MIYSKRHRLHGVKPIAWKVAHELPMLPAQYLIPVPSPVVWEPDWIEPPECAMRCIDVPKLFADIKRSLEEFNDQVKANA